MTVVAGARDALVCTLDDARARDPQLVGSKAASLARSRLRGLPVVPGFATTTGLHRGYLESGRRLSEESEQALLSAWSALSEDGRRPVVVRSSSTLEDVVASSMAGRFRSVLDVRGRDALLEAVLTVLRSADEVGAGPPGPMGVLVQRHVDPDRGDVMFGVDPVTGAADRLVVEAVAGGPDTLVSGRVTAQHYVLSRRGRLLTLDHRPAGARRRRRRRRLLSRPDLLRLAHLARRTERVFGRPQDVEWAIEADGTLLLLQSRPVTATAAAATTGPVLGPGPLGETFPDPLSRLEADLWLRPLRAGVLAALCEMRVVPQRRLRLSPVVTTVTGRVAADLELLGYVPARPSTLQRLDPRPAFRRLSVAWRTGVVRADLPRRAAELVAEVDAVLAGADLVPATDSELVDLLDRSTALLERLHHAEVLAGSLLRSSDATAAAMALAVLRSLGPEASRPDAVRAHPVLLALLPPSLAGPTALPPPPPAAPPVRGLGPRESLRLRVRWVQELGARAALELERRLAGRELVGPGVLALLEVDELHDLLRSGGCPQTSRSGPPRTSPPRSRRRCPRSSGSPSTARWCRWRGAAHGPRAGYLPAAAAAPGRSSTARCAGPRRPGRSWSSASCSRVSRPTCPGSPAWSPRPAAPSRTWRSWPGSTAYRRWSRCTTRCAGSHQAPACSSTAPPVRSER